MVKQHLNGHTMSRNETEPSSTKTTGFAPSSSHLVTSTEVLGVQSEQLRRPTLRSTRGRKKKEGSFGAELRENAKSRGSTQSRRMALTLKRHRNGEDSLELEPPVKKNNAENLQDYGEYQALDSEFNILHDALLHNISRETCTSPAPFTGDPKASAERESIDYSIKITKEMAVSGKAPRPIRVYADGIYDMFHSGHARQLMQAKNCFPGVYLIVGVCNDALTQERKGRVVMNEVERYEAIRHCRYVDELVNDAPWELDDEYLIKHKIDFVAHDDLPYGAGDEADIYKWLKDKGMFVATQRTEGISTTDVIARIIRDYDMYVRRNLARGYTAKELNVSFMREKRIQLQEKVDLMKGKLLDKRHQLMDKGQDMLHKWEEKSKDFIGGFLDLFGREGKFNQWWNESRIRMARAISPASSPIREEPSSTSYRSPSPNFSQSAALANTQFDDSDSD